MKGAKKDRLEGGASKRPSPRLAPRNLCKDIISDFRQKARPNLDRGGGDALPPAVWGQHRALYSAQLSKKRGLILASVDCVC